LFGCEMRRPFPSVIPLLVISSICAAAQGGSTSFRLQGKSGHALVEWVSESTFRFCLGREASSCAAGGVEKEEALEVERTESESSHRFTTEFLDVIVDRTSLQLRVLDSEGKSLMEDLGEPLRSNGGLVVERSAGTAERFFGLGMRGRTPIDARRQRIEAMTPLLVSSQGYGLHHVAPGDYVFELASEQPDTYRILIRNAAWLDFYFYYGPRPKDVLEEHRKVTGAPEMPKSWQFGVIARNQRPRGATPLPVPGEASWTTLCEAARAMINGSMSAVLIPAFDLTPYLSSPTALFRAAALFGSVTPVTLLDHPAILLEPDKLDAFSSMSRLRKRLQSHLVSYSVEANTRGLPIIHPLPLQFPNDVEASRAEETFMLGDELLVAPLCSDADRRQVYLPMGVWTDLHTNATHRGRQTVSAEARGGEPPIFIKNGSILPLNPLKTGEAMLLHYIPNLAAEYFLYEPDIGDYSQLHAGPAGDAMRLEIESRKERLYEWVVHHVPEVREAAMGDVKLKKAGSLKELRPGAWYYDRNAGNIHVRVHAGKGADSVVYINFF